MITREQAESWYRGENNGLSNDEVVGFYRNALVEAEAKLAAIQKGPDQEKLQGAYAVADAAFNDFNRRGEKCALNPVIGCEALGVLASALRAESAKVAEVTELVKMAGRMVCGRCSIQLDYPVAKGLECFACGGFRNALSRLRAEGPKQDGEVRS